MADGGVDIDLYADDIESDFNRQVSCVKVISNIPIFIIITFYQMGLS